MKNSFSGTGVALITPFKSDFSVDYPALKNIVRFLIDGGVDYLVALGTTSEAATLNETEKKLVVQAILEENNQQTPVVVGVGGNNTQAIVDQLKKMNPEELSAVLSVVPYYNKPQQGGILAHFTAIANNSPLPVILYNVPGRTSANMKAETTLQLASHHNICAVKEASGDFNQIMQVVQHKPAEFEVLSGDDALTLPLLASGASGVISVTANAFPAEFSQMVSLVREGKLEQARKIHYHLLRMTELFFADGSPAGVKSLLALRGMCSDTVRLPLVNVNEQIRKQISDEWHRLNR